MAEPQEAKTWATPEYWGGPWVDSPSTIDAPKRPAAPFKSAQHAAAHVMATALEGVLQGDYEDTPGTEGGRFDPETMGVEDGSVVLLERERLIRMQYRGGWAKPVDLQRGDLPDDISEFAEYWRKHSEIPPPTAHVDYRTFGTLGSELSYQRSLQWGVVVHHLGAKAIFTWDPSDFDHGLDIRDGVVRFHPDMKDLSILPTPIAIGKTEAARKGSKSIVLPRAIERTTAVRLVNAEGTADYQQAYDNAEPLGSLEYRLYNHGAYFARGAELLTAAYLSGQS